MINFEFLKGIARIVDFGGLINKYDRENNPSNNQSDADAIKSDWIQVGKDMRKAMSYYGEQSK